MKQSCRELDAIYLCIYFRIGMRSVSLRGVLLYRAGRSALRVAGALICCVLVNLQKGLRGIQRWRARAKTIAVYIRRISRMTRPEDSHPAEQLLSVLPSCS